MNFSIFVHFHEILIFLLTLNKKYDIIITVNKERKMIMGKIKFTREEMTTMIDMLNSMVTDEKYLSVHMTRNCPFWKNQEIMRDYCGSCSCSYCVSSNMLVFLDIIKDIIIKGKSPIDALTEKNPAKEQTTKVRVYSDEDYVNNTLAWLALTDEQLRLFNYLFNNGYLMDGIDYEECEEPEVKTV